MHVCNNRDLVLYLEGFRRDIQAADTVLIKRGRESTTERVSVTWILPRLNIRDSFKRIRPRGEAGLCTGLYVSLYLMLPSLIVDRATLFQLIGALYHIAKH